MTGYRARMTGTGVVARQSPNTQVGQGSLGEILTQIGQIGVGVARQEYQLKEQQLNASHEAEIAMLERQRSSTIAKKMGEMAELGGSIDQELDSQRNFVDPAEWDAKADEIVRTRWTKFADTLGDDPGVRERFEPAIARQRESTISREEDFSRLERAKAGAQGFETWATAAKGKLSRSDKPDEVYQNYVTDLVTYASGLDLPRAAVQQLIETEARDGAMQMFDRLVVQQRFDEAEQLANAPEFDALLGGDPREKIIKTIDNEKRALAALAAAEQSAARTAAREGISAILQKIELGINPTAAEIKAARDAAVAAGGLEADLVALDGKGLQQITNRQYAPENDPTGQKASATAKALGVKVANGTATQAEQVTYQQLLTIKKERSKEFGGAMKELVGQGIAGKMTVLSQIDTMSPEQRFDAAEAAQPGLGRFALMGPTTRKYALDGQEVRKARPEEFGKKAEVNTAFKMRVGAVARQLGGEYDDVMNSAWNIYAGTINAKGMTGWHPEYFDTAVKIAFGATTRSDGKLQGGVGKTRGHQVVLPPTYTVPEFERSLSRMTFKGAVYAGGTPAAKADILEHYRPEYYEDGPDGHAMYRFIDAAGKPLLHKDGSVYNIGFRR